MILFQTSKITAFSTECCQGCNILLAFVNFGRLRNEVRFCTLAFEAEFHFHSAVRYGIRIKFSLFPKSDFSLRAPKRVSNSHSSFCSKVVFLNGACQTNLTSFLLIFNIACFINIVLPTYTPFA